MRFHRKIKKDGFGFRFSLEGWVDDAALSAKPWINDPERLGTLISITLLPGQNH